MLFAWSIHVERRMSAYDIIYYAWDVCRLAADKGRAFEFLLPLESDFSISDVIAAADRPECETDSLVIDELASVYFRHPEWWDALEAPDDEKAALAAFFTEHNEKALEKLTVERLRREAQRALDDFRGIATQEEADAWKAKYASVEHLMRRTDIQIASHEKFTVAHRRNAPILPEEPQGFAWRSPSEIPKMPWLYGKHLLRGCASLTIAPGGVGKTYLKVAETVAMVTGRTLMHHDVERPLRVWFCNLEEPMDILERRFHAAFQEHGVRRCDIGDRLYVSDSSTNLVIVRQTRDGVEIAEPVKDILIQYIQENAIDVLSIDPFVSSHAVNENDNMAIDRVVKTYAAIARETGCAIDLVHHSRKTNGNAVTIDDGRGASSMVGAVRAGRVLNVMSTEEATKAGIEHRFQYVRVDDAKPNHAARADKAEWFHLKSVRIANGDDMAAVVPWYWPEAMAGIDEGDLGKVWLAIKAGEWRENVQAANWVGKPVADTLGMDLADPVDKAKVKAMIAKWLKDGLLVRVTKPDEKRMPRTYIEVRPVPVLSPMPILPPIPPHHTLPPL